MTPKERAAMQQALEALEEYRDTQMIKAPRRAITDLREALARDNMSPTEHAVIQQALEHKRSCAYKRIDQNPSECTCGVTKAIAALREALDHSGEANEMVLTGLRITNLDDKLEFEPVYSEPVKRPQNCGTGYCSCIECPHETEQAEQEPVGNNDWKRVSYIRETLNAEQAEQEPVAYMFKVKRTLPSSTPIDVFAAIEYHPLPHDDIISKEPLYAAPVRTKDLTDDEIRDALDGCEYDEDTPFEITEARAVIAADRRKNRA